jgi:membrane protease YdiL (CAAX protease family)
VFSKIVSSFFLLFGGAFAGAFLFTPIVYSTIRFFYPAVAWPFSRVFDRVAMFFALILIYWQRHTFHLSLIKPYLIQGSFNRRVNLILVGVFLSLLPSIGALLIILADSKLRWGNFSYSLLAWKMFTVVPAALIISFIEEITFRIILLGALLKRLPVWLAASVSSALYALVHFISPVKDFAYPKFEALAGVRYAEEVILRILSPGSFEAAIGLFLVGILLCSVIQRSTSLFLCIGLHTGWVIILKFARFTTRAEGDFRFASGIGERYFLVAESIGWASIILVGILTHFYLHYKSKDEAITNSVV